MYVKLQNGQPSKFPYTLGDLRADNPGTSFPAVIAADTLAAFDVRPVTPVPAPAFDGKTHRLEQGVELVADTWTQTWTTQQLPEADASANVREERNSRLVDCDWTQLSDAPIEAAAWTDYRQALRDISSQPGFPWDITWPDKPIN